MAAFTVIPPPSLVPILRSMLSAIVPAPVSISCVQDGSTLTLTLDSHNRLPVSYNYLAMGVASYGTGASSRASEALSVRYNPTGIREQSNWQRLWLPMYGAGNPKHGPNLSLPRVAL